MTKIIPGDSSGVKPDVPYYVKGLALGIPAILLGLQLAGWIAYVPVITHGHSDFRQLYAAGYMLRTGHARELYDYQTEKIFQDALVSPEEIALPFNHLAYEALLYAPFSLFRYQLAYFAFLTFNLALLATSFLMLRSYMGKLAQVLSWLPAATFLCFLPITAALMQGQDSIVLMILLIAATVQLDRGQEITAGIFVGLALFKFQIVLPIAFLFLAWRRWRFCAGFMISATTVAGVSLLLVGFAQVRAYVQLLTSMSAVFSGGDQFMYAIYPNRMANLRGLVFGMTGTHASVSWIRTVTFVLSAGVLLWVAWRAPAKRGMDALLVAITASSLVSYHLLIHDMSVLLIPIAIILNRFIEAEATGDAYGRLAARTAALMFVAPLCISFAPDHFYLVSLPLCTFLYAQIRGPRRAGVVR